MPRITGCDVSAFQPGTNWSAARTAGCRFAHIKATDGLHWRNPWLAHDVAGTRAAGIPSAPYHFFRPNVDAAEQADFFLSTFKQRSGDFRPMFDWELSERMSIEAQKEGALRFLRIVAAEIGADPFLYSYEAYLEALGDLSAFSRNPLHIAAYRTRPPHVPAAWQTFTIWQTSGHGSLSGVQTAVDLDLFNGDEAAFAKFLVP